MNIDITRLASSLDDYTYIDEVYSFSKDKLLNSGILSLDNLKVKGFVTKNSLDDYIIDIDVFGTMVLPCSLSLEPTNYKIVLKIEGNLAEIYEEMGEKAQL